MKLRTLLACGVAFILGGLLAAQAQLPGVNSTLQTVFTYMYEASTNKATYSVTMGTIPASTPTDVCMLQGSSTKTIRVRRVIVGGVATAVQAEPVAVIRRASAPATGASTAFTPGKYDSSSSAATARADIYTTNATVLGVPTVLADFLVTWGNYTTGVGSGSVQYNFGVLASPVFLRGTSEVLAINLGGITSAGLQFTCTFEWTEE